MRNLSFKMNEKLEDKDTKFFNQRVYKMKNIDKIDNFFSNRKNYKSVN